MATSVVETLAVCSSVTGNTLTLNGETFGSTGLGTLTIAAASAVPTDVGVNGLIHGAVYLPFIDSDTLDGVLMPNDLATSQIALTQGGADATLALVVEEIYND